MEINVSMKRIIIAFIVFLVTATCVFAQTGIWSGNLSVQGMELPLVFHLDDENPTLDSPAQGAKGIPIQVERNQDNIIVKIPMIGASYEGILKEGKMEGSFTQRGFSFPLILTPGEVEAKRPQTPKPPYPYTREDVSFINGNAVLKGTLVLPEGYDRTTPAVLMITGSGLQNRDEEMFEHKPFAVIADALARSGIATLRYDDRGFGESTGDVANCTTEDFKNDAMSGVSLLKKLFDTVGVLGHSEGGTIALMLGAENNVDFIVSLAGMAVSGAETLIDQNRKLLGDSGVPDISVENYCRLLEDTFRAVTDSTAMPDVENYNLPQPLAANYREVLNQLRMPYLIHFLQLEPRRFLDKVGVPVLALNGTKDCQVNYLTNLEALEKGLPENPANKIQSMEGLNHLFQHCLKGTPDEYNKIEETFAPEALELIIDWIAMLPRLPKQN